MSVESIFRLNGRIGPDKFLAGPPEEDASIQVENAFLRPMQEGRRHRRARLAVGFACAQIALVGQHDAPPFTIDGEAVLRHRMGEAVQRCVDARRDEKKARHE